MKNQIYSVIINCNLEYKFKAGSAEEAKQMVENVELPNSYVEDSFEIVKIIEKNGKEFSV